jgi:hypothetical protein
MMTKNSPKSDKPAPKQSADKPKAAKKPAAKAAEPVVAKPAPTAKAAVKKKPTLVAAASGMMNFDTSLLASSAANMLLARTKGRDTLADPISVDQIKSDLNKPAANAAGHALGDALRSNLPVVEDKTPKR